MAYDLILDEPRQKRVSFIKYLMIGGALGMLTGLVFFIFNYQSTFEKNPAAFVIVLISLIVVLVGLYLINKSRMDVI